MAPTAAGRERGGVYVVACGFCVGWLGGNPTPGCEGVRSEGFAIALGSGPTCEIEPGITTDISPTSTSFLSTSTSSQKKNVGAYSSVRNRMARLSSDGSSSHTA